MPIVKKIKKAIKKRYVSSRGKPRVNNIVKDVARLKRILNPELKTFVINNDPSVDDGIDIGQVSGNSNGYFALDITPIPAQGTTSITRTGNSIKLSKIVCSFLMFQQASSASPIQGKLVFVHVKGAPVASATAAVTSYYNPNPFLNVDIVDYHSMFDEDKRKQYTVLATKYFKIGSDTVSSVEMGISLRHTLYFKNHHVKFDADASQSVAEGQILMFVLVNSGNAANSTASTVKNIMPTAGAVTTGMTLNYNIESHFYDN